MMARENRSAARTRAAAWIGVAVLATTFATEALAQGTQGSAGRAQGASKGASLEADADVLVAHGNNSGKGIDPKLTRYKELKNPPFSSFNSYALIEESSRRLVQGKGSSMKLPGGGELTVTLDGAEEKNGKPSRYLLKATMKKPGGEESSLQVKAKSGATFFVAGQRHDNGILVLGIRVR